MSYTDLAIMPTARQPSKYSLGRLLYTSLFFVMILQACFSPDPRTVPGLIEATAKAVEAQDAEQVFRFLDEEARHALWGIVRARQDAKHLIDTKYPSTLRAEALTALGDGAQVQTGAQLFALRCNQECINAIGAQLGAPAGITTARDITHVTTVRGTKLALRSPKGGGWYGLLWNSEALDRERDRAFRELAQIEENAALYQRQRDLARPVAASTGAESPLQGE